MARSRGILYFAPETPYSEVRIDDDEIISQFRDRLVGFYLRPAKQLIAPETTFAAGVLVICCMDALSRYDVDYHRFTKHSERFPKWIAGELRSFQGDEKLAIRFYKAFRCGLVHEARIKYVGEFSLDTKRTVTLHGNFFVINPYLLLDEVLDALNVFVSKSIGDNAFAQHFKAEMRKDFGGHFPVGPKRSLLLVRTGKFQGR
jgi:hypothetical protein